MSVSVVLQILVVAGAIILGVRMGGIGLGLWGVAGVGVLVFVFELPPGSPPINAMLIILAVITAAAAMQAAGGIDFLVRVATKIIQKNPKQLNYIAPLVSFIFTVAAGTSNIFYPLVPVIYQTAYDNGIRPERPLATATVANVYGITCSPVAAAMAVMVGLVGAPEYGWSLGQILLITIPSALVAIVVMAFVQNRIGKPLEEDPVYQERLKAGLIAPPQSQKSAEESPAGTPEGSGRERVRVPCRSRLRGADRIPGVPADGAGRVRRARQSRRADHHPDHHVRRRADHRAHHQDRAKGDSLTVDLRRGYRRHLGSVRYRLAR